MRYAFRLIIRKTRSHLPQLLGLIILLVVGVCFFITLFTISEEYEKTAEQYFINQNYADTTFYGSFNDESVRLLSELDGVKSAKGRIVSDYRDGTRIFRAVSLTDGINVPYIYTGRLPMNQTECVLLKRNADSMNLSIGDTITLGDKPMIISGLAASPEYVYMVQNERTMMAQTDRFGVVYVTKDFYTNSYNEIVTLADGDISDYSEKIGSFRATLMKDQINHIMYLSDLEQIKTFAYIFPFMFAVLIAVVINVMLKRTIQKDRKQIGTMKALGVSDAKIIGIYISQFCIAALVGALLGCFIAIFASDFIIDIFSAMYEVPELSFEFYPWLWTGAVSFSVLLCAFSGMISLFSILLLMPAHAMRPLIPKGSRRILLERIGFMWERASFNTRYALKNSLRNKGRFFAVVLGMCGSCALLVLSLGFYDSAGNTKESYFNGFANYDLIVNFDPIPFDMEYPASKLMDESQCVLIIPVEIRDENYTLAITESGFDMVDIPNDALHKGIIIPTYFAEKWGVDIGDTLKINDYNAVVSAISPQYLGLTLYTHLDYINTITDEMPTVYNTIYSRTRDKTALINYLKEKNIDFTTIDDDKTSFSSIMKTMSVLIWFMIACSVVLGFTVLYSVGLINLASREYEYMFMGVMGYPHKSIIMAHVKETVLQLIFAIPLGFILGRLLLEGIRGEFSGSSFVLAATIYPQSYLISALSVIGVTVLMTLLTSQHIGKLNIVEGLKAQDN